ncbi:hypothetical protein KP79_PYT25038 [Mizuhopecten yessoensis]|uniref:Uncharacterized protein n=1 Tax=Mizuhopecten yessoensis TaxID=6573 RepID=A0A210PZ26_MIZYE|nr:hypothetical protein KP79_PYT25038 [Mizuhopecten yessoensis]
MFLSSWKRRRRGSAQLRDFWTPMQWQLQAARIERPKMKIKPHPRTKQKLAHIVVPEVMEKAPHLMFDEMSVQHTDTYATCVIAIIILKVFVVVKINLSTPETVTNSQRVQLYLMLYVLSMILSLMPLMILAR